MEALNILLIGTGIGVIFAVLSMLMINSSNSEKYPVGGFLPSLFMIADLGMDSKVVVAGILMMGGMTGFYLTLTFWKVRPESLKRNLHQAKDSSDSSIAVTTDENSTITVSGKSLADFL